MKLLAQIKTQLCQCLTPCRKNLVQHAKRANFQTVIWKREHVPFPDIPKANDRHGWHECDGKLQPLWTEKEEELTLPEAVINNIIAESDSIEGEEPNVPRYYDSDTDFYDSENDSDSEEDKCVQEF